MARPRNLQPLLRQLQCRSLTSSSLVPAVAKIPPSSLRQLACNRRSFQTYPAKRSVYDDFRNIIDPAESGVMVDNVSETTFKLTDGIILPSNLILLNGGGTLMWDVPPPSLGWEGWTKEMFEVFEVVSPKPDILLFGMGRSALPPPPWLRPYLNSLGIQLDIMDSRNACSTFNLLAEEGRRVSAACLTLAPLESRTGAPIEGKKT